jgi:hypothetical protein
VFLRKKASRFRDRAERKRREHCFSRLSSFSLKLFCFDSANGAAISASAAIQAFVVDYVNTFRVVHCDCAYGAGVSASAACQAFIRDDMCHCDYLRFFTFCFFIIAYFFRLVKDYKKKNFIIFLFFWKNGV